ncbi:MFS transporter [Sphingomonas sp. DT-207]|uniref:MFS transporter n=1 Tax=Sphingomonas sp. DT-207 TaxID=3396167 RepID=UPI003F1B3273
MQSDTIAQPRLALTLVVTATVLGIMGTDLVLPAVPSLPQGLGGNAAEAQLVLAAYVGGTSLGLLVYGALGDRLPTRWLFIASLVLTGIVSFACAFASSMWMLIPLRAIQGSVAAGPAVFAPAIVRSMFDEAGAIRALGALGSIEALAPALAPILGIWLLAFGGWTLSFKLMGAIALALAALNLVLPLIPQTSRRAAGSYARLIADPVYLRYALSQAFVLGGLLVFVFGAPAVMVHSLGGNLVDFIIMQVCGIATFILAANLASRFVARFGAEPMITFGTVLAAVGALAMLSYALAGGARPHGITVFFVPINIGLGLRGPPGFYRAVLASHGDDARGSALVILFIMLATAGGTAAAAPFIQQGLVPLAATAAVLEAVALACLLLPKMPNS